MARQLGDDVRRGTESIKTQPFRVARFAKRPVPDQPGAKQRRRAYVIERVRNRERKPRVGHGELSVAAINRVSGEPRPLTQVLATRSAILAFATGPADPRNPDAIPNSEVFHSATDFFDAPDNLVSGNQ